MGVDVFTYKNSRMKNEEEPAAHATDWTGDRTYE
jgi:hypothetical protein